MSKNNVCEKCIHYISDDKVKFICCGCIWVDDKKEEYMIDYYEPKIEVTNE